MKTKANWQKGDDVIFLDQAVSETVPVEVLFVEILFLKHCVSRFVMFYE